MQARGSSIRLLGCHGIALALSAAVMLGGCASTSPSLNGPSPDHLAAKPASAEEAQQSGGSLEKWNRDTLANNQKFNEQIIYPIADAYHDTVPEPVRESVGNFTSNLGEPVIVANDILQLRFKAAAVTAGRFLVNSTIGLGGLFDVASQQELPKQTGDFGQTLYVWGVRESPFVVLPVLGPTNVRDAVGNGIEIAATAIPAAPVLGANLAKTVSNVNRVGTALTPFSSLDKVSQLRELEKGSLDFYALLRSVVEQKRQAELDGAVAESALWGATATVANGEIVTASIPTPEAAHASTGGELPGGEAQRSPGSTLPGGKIVIGAEPVRPASSQGKIVIGPAAGAKTETIVIGPETSPRRDGKIVIGPAAAYQ